jgi:hypothetical protein
LIFTACHGNIFSRKRCRNLLTFQIIDITLKLERVFDTRHEGGIIIMTDNEMELIKIIRENDNPEQALMTAAVIIVNFLKQRGSFEVQAAVVPPAHVGIN